MFRNTITALLARAAVFAVPAISALAQAQTGLSQQAAIGIKVGSWEIHPGGPPVAYETSDNVGMVSALDNATIPPQDDAEWKRTSDATVNIHEKSAITNKDKTTVDYTFFQVIVTVPEGANITTFQVNFDQVDDAARVWIFNSKHPEGAYFPKADVLAGGQNVTVAADFKAEVTAGENRIVITQYDNYPVLNTIKGIHILVDGQEVKPPTLSDVAGTETNKLVMEFKLIPAGTFLMGSPDSEEGRDDDERQHEVTITRDFYMGVTEVTQSQWQQVMGTTPWKGQERVIEGDDVAASYISWNDAVEFCQRLSQQEGRTYRLPTEAEWEYACRAGTTTAYSFGDDASQLEQYAWYFDSEPTHPSQVKQKSPNGFGLYDMHGNVWEHCQDWYSASYGASAQDQSSPSQQAELVGLTNPGFEETQVKEGTFELVETIPGWKTTDTEFEIWGTGFKGVPAHEGTQFAELNAHIDGTLYQDSTGIEAGSVLEFTFAHRGRNGDDTMKLTITDLGADNALGGDDDTILFTKQYTTGNDAWAVYNSTTEEQIKALGNTVRFGYGAVSTATGVLGEGNLLDAADFGIGVVSIPRSVTDPTGPSSGSKRIKRSGSFLTKVPYLRSAVRQVTEDLAVGEKSSGFRVVMVPETATAQAEYQPTGLMRLQTFGISGEDSENHYLGIRNDRVGIPDETNPNSGSIPVLAVEATDGGMTLHVFNSGGQYLTARGNEIVLSDAPEAGSAWRIRDPLKQDLQASDGWFSLESASDPGRYLRHYGLIAFAHKAEELNENEAEHFLADASWRFVDAKVFEYSIEVVSGDGQTYSGGGMHKPMVIRIKDNSGQYLTDLESAGLTIDVSANKQGEYDFPFSNGVDDEKDKSLFEGYYYVPAIDGGTPYKLQITVQLKKADEVVGECMFQQNIR